VYQRDIYLIIKYSFVKLYDIIHEMTTNKIYHFRSKSAPIIYYHQYDSQIYKPTKTLVKTPPQTLHQILHKTPPPTPSKTQPPTPSKTQPPKPPKTPTPPPTQPTPPKTPPKIDVNIKYKSLVKINVVHDDDNNNMNFENPQLLQPLKIKLQPQPQKICIVLDWDDTIFPSTHIIKLFPTLEIAVDVKFQETKVFEELQILENIVLSKISQLCMIADVFIVTNSLQGWVELVSRKFCPRLWNYVSTIPILSARSMYEQTFPEDSYIWKYFAIQSCINVDLHTRLVSLGDSPQDKTVSTNICIILNLDLKFIQFERYPNIQTLIQQWEKIDIENISCL
jgi:hypothetical protein